jgi:activator of 2-hydroxyglutaryl-CoA dehydratase
MISVLEKGAKKEDVAAGLHHALARRIAEIVPDAERIVVIGGVARNRSMLFALSAALDRKLFVPPEPQMVNALGAAAFALSQDRRK